MEAIPHGLLAIGILLALLAFGIPVAYALGLATVIAILVAGDSLEIIYIAASLVEGLDSFELLAIPLFVMMGAVISASPAAADLYGVLHRLFPFRGGLGVTTVAGCALFSALSGSSPATAATIGSSGIPEMIRRGYPSRLAAGIIVGGGTLGILIPPSVVLIIYGIVTQTSIGRLFLAGIVPGILIVVLFSAYVVFATRRSTTCETTPDENLPVADVKPPARHALLRVLPFFALIVSIMAALYGGWASPSEIAALSAVGAILLVAFIYRLFRAGAWVDIFAKAVRETSFIMLIAAFSYYFNQHLAFQGTISEGTKLLVNFHDNPWITLGLLSLVMLAMGLFLPPFAIVVIVAPMFLPYITSAGFDSVWFGILVTILMEMGLMTPPVGVNLFVVQAIAPELKLSDIIIGSMPFFGLLVISVILLCIFPQLALWLPETLL